MWEGGSIFLMKYDARLSVENQNTEGYGRLEEWRQCERELPENESGRKDGLWLWSIIVGLRCPFVNYSQKFSSEPLPPAPGSC